MVTPELVNYIKVQLSQGKTKEEVRGVLLYNGWNSSDLDSAFLQLFPISVAEKQEDSMKEEIIKKKRENIFDFQNYKWYEWFAMLPFFTLVVIGGMIGGVMGFLGGGLTLTIISKKKMSLFLKIFLIIVVISLSYILSFILAGVVDLMLLS